MYWYIIFNGNETYHSRDFDTFYNCKRDALSNCFCYNNAKISISIFKHDFIIQTIRLDITHRQHFKDWSY